MKKTSQSHVPVISKCICAWSDLLGFGAALRRGGWHDIELILPTLERVVSLQRTVLTSACDTERIFMVNDGVARNLDFEPQKGFYRLIGWLRDVWLAHTRINATEHQHGHPGIRTVVAAGSRVTYSAGDKKKSETILARRPNWTLQDVEDLFVPEFLDQISFYVPFEFQMNLAFAKAYSLEAAGSRSGLNGPRFFLDKSVVDFLLSTVNGTNFEFLIGNGSAMKPVRIEHLQNGETNKIIIRTPDNKGEYHQSSVILMDPEEIRNEHSGLWSTNFIMYPYADPDEYLQRN